MEVDKDGEDVSTIWYTKVATTVEVGEVERTKEDDFYLSGLELPLNSHVNVSRPMSLETQIQT